MKVSGIVGASAAAPAAKTGKAVKTGEGSFAEKLSALDQPEEGVQGVDSAPSVGGIATLLAAQASGDSLDREARRRLVDYGESLLDKLEELRHGLLLGAIPKDKLIALAQLVRSRRDTTSDPRLSSILDDIELRVEVELAKLTPR